MQKIRLDSREPPARRAQCQHSQARYTMQVSPLKWSSARYRSVLDQALQDTVSDELIHEASSAIEEGFQGSLARCPSQTLSCKTGIKM